MPRLDPLRRTISVTEEQLELLRVVFNEQIDGHWAGLAGLRDSGLITAEGSVHRLVGDLINAMRRPLLELWVERLCQSGATVSHVVVRNDGTLWFTDPRPGGGPEDEVVFVKDELSQLLPILARLVGVRGSTPPDWAMPVAVNLTSVASVLAAFSAESESHGTARMSGGRWDDVRTVAIARLEEFFGDMPADQRPTWVAVLATLENTCRVTCAWGPETRHSRGLTVWDCSPGWSWIGNSPAEPSPEHVDELHATFTPVNDDDLWGAFAGLLPSRAELTDLGADLSVVKVAHQLDDLRRKAGASMPADGRPHCPGAAELATLHYEHGPFSPEPWQSFSDWIETIGARALALFSRLEGQGQLIETGIQAFLEYQVGLKAGRRSWLGTANVGKARAYDLFFKVNCRWGEKGAAHLKGSSPMALQTHWLRKGMAAVDSFYLARQRTLFAPGVAAPRLRPQADEAAARLAAARHHDPEYR